MATRAVFGLADLWGRLDALDGRIPAALQLDLYARVRELLVDNTAAYLRSGQAAADLRGTITRHTRGRKELEAALPDIALSAQRQRIEAEARRLAGAGVPDDIATRIARFAPLADAPAIVETAEAAGSPVARAARLWLEAGERFHLDALLLRASTLEAGDDYDQMALAGARDAISDARRRITLAALAANGHTDAGLEAWSRGAPDRVQRVERELAGVVAGAEITVSRLTVAAVRLADIARLGASSTGGSGLSAARP
jgi:glutamate dehydrogenase